MRDHDSTEHLCGELGDAELDQVTGGDKKTGSEIREIVIVKRGTSHQRSCGRTRQTHEAYTCATTTQVN
jgi:hypothetical protein